MEEENNSRFNIWQNAKMSMSMGRATVMSLLAFMTFEIKASNKQISWDSPTKLWCKFANGVWKRVILSDSSLKSILIHTTRQN